MILVGTLVVMWAAWFMWGLVCPNEKAREKMRRGGFIIGAPSRKERAWGGFFGAIAVGLFAILSALIMLPAFVR
ncbi:MAG: hypothetical protein V1899_02795 [Planctomycetota bacterium]